MGSVPTARIRRLPVAGIGRVCIAPITVVRHGRVDDHVVAGNRLTSEVLMDRDAGIEDGDHDRWRAPRHGPGLRSPNPIGSVQAPQLAARVSGVIGEGREHRDEVIRLRPLHPWISRKFRRELTCGALIHRLGDLDRAHAGAQRLVGQQGYLANRIRAGSPPGRLGGGHPRLIGNDEPLNLRLLTQRGRRKNRRGRGRRSDLVDRLNGQCNLDAVVEVRDRRPVSARRNLHHPTAGKQGDDIARDHR
ncbi:unannotated protein [freshwater metagenome]|uniref:Unannotated protein n=1 Tax=freshwater metagenome TaxID=449393 RepID=A0A6J6UIU8_9ZZZZ